MGTNYYTRINCCDKCERYDEIHIGKQSWGWAFCFAIHPDMEIVNACAWKNFLMKNLFEQKIYDEYGNVISYDDFWSMVEANKNKYSGVKEHPDYFSLDYEGYCMCSGEFS